MHRRTTAYDHILLPPSRRPNGSGPGYYTYYVLNATSLVEPLLSPALTIDGQPITEIQLIDLVNKAESENPGSVIAPSANLTTFFDRGGKLLHYMGGADPLVPTYSSLNYYQRILEANPAANTSYRYYEIPGMAHCGGGLGTGNFGQADQVVSAAGGAYQSKQFDAEHDALLALRNWRERQQAPGKIIASKFNGDDIKKGVSTPSPFPCSLNTDSSASTIARSSSLQITFERPICPYPQSARYTGGDLDEATSFECT